jgi:hypothetical protein
MKNRWEGKLKKDPLPWLLESNPWTKYKVLTELLDESDSTSSVIDAKQKF